MVSVTRRMPHGRREVSINDDGSGPATGPSSAPANAGPNALSFEDAFEAELVADLGDLGPGAAEADTNRGGGGSDRRSPRGRSRRR